MTDALQSEVGWFHPSRGAYRYTVLLFVGLLPFGSYFAYDSIGAMATTLMKAWHTDQSAIGGMYTIYSVAAIICVLLAGLMIDRIGTRLASLILSGLVVGGACVVALAPNITIAAAGRFIFGAGSESLIVAQSAILARWFRGKELALSFGVTLAIMRLGTLFSFNTVSSVVETCDRTGCVFWQPGYGFKAALWVAAGLCAFSLLCNLVYFAMDKHGERALGLAEAGAGDKIVFADVKKFGHSYWYVVALCATFYSAIFPFTALSTDFFHEKWGLPLSMQSGVSFLAKVFNDFLHMFSTAGGTTSIIIFASMCLAAFAGGFVDRVGRRASLMLLGALLMIPCYLTLGFTMVPPWAPMILLGAAFVLVPAAMWPSVPLIVEKNVTGTAFGLMTMIQNAGLALFPYLNGKLRVATHSYSASMVMFAALGAVGFGFALLLLRADRREGGALERGAAKA
jgi:MFS family permease